MGVEKTELRYLDLKNDICARIYNGTYRNGERIPSERQLTVDYDISRITVRKALELMEEEGLVKREVGNGTIVQYRNLGNETSLDLFALVAPSKNPFFSSFIAEFQKIAWEHDALLLYVEIPEGTSLEDCLYRLYQKNIKNAVVWSDDQSVNEEKLLRLRSIGMNLVFFDTDDAYPYADCVYLDNEDAIKKLLATSKKAYKKYFYIGWDNLAIRNNTKREDTFRALCRTGNVIRVPWRRDRKIMSDSLERIAKEVAAKLQQDETDIEDCLLVCGAGEIGQQVAQYLYGNRRRRADISIIDNFDGSEKYSVSLYQQNLGKTARTIYDKMKEQTVNGKAWKAELIKVKGEYKTT